MSKENKNIKKEYNLSDAPSPTPNPIEGETLINNYFTICPECKSPIEILLINLFLIMKKC